MTEEVLETKAMDSNIIDIDYFFKVKLRVAQVLSAERIEKSTKLLKLRVTLGESLGERQIIAGIGKFYSPEDLLNKKIIVVANLKPALLMGNESQGMLLAAASSNGEKLTIVDPGQDMPPGSEVR